LAVSSRDGGGAPSSRLETTKMAGDGNEVIATVRDLGVSVAVRNLDETARWYWPYLGFEEVLEREFPEYGTRIVFLEANGILMELIEDEKWQAINRPDPPQHTTVQGVSQITFRVADIQTVIDRRARES
jgi:catechol 2,3-dioxygenase-like lactoylglutathione lyase family enzyme